MVDAYSASVERARADGFVALKSIIAYRTGLAVQPTSRADAAAAFGPVKERARRDGRVRLATKPLNDSLLLRALEIAERQAMPVRERRLTRDQLVTPRPPQRGDPANGPRRSGGDLHLAEVPRAPRSASMGRSSADGHVLRPDAYCPFAASASAFHPVAPISAKSRRARSMRR